MRRSWVVLCCVLWLVSACKKEAPKPTAPAKVANARKESDLATLTLTPEAEKRLGIELGAVERRTVAQHRELGGEVAAPPGRDVNIVAPLAGTLLPPASGSVPAAGTRVTDGQVLFRLSPLPPADRELQRDRAREEAEAASARARAATAQAERAKKLRELGAGSVRGEEEARSAAGQADAALKGARERLRFLSSTDLEAAARVNEALRVEAPRAGLLMDVAAAPGQSVTAGTVLAHLVSDDLLWVRVPVYAGDLRLVDRTVPAHVTRLGGGEGWAASVTTAPATATASAATTDVVYALPRGTGLRAGERVSVTLPLTQSAEALVVPWRAVLYDIEGGTWVYRVVQPQVYSRSRVEIRHVIGAFAVLNRGPEPGTKVVSAGAPELFGEEFGTK